MAEQAYRLGKWVVEPLSNTVRRGGRVAHLKPKSMAVLERLIEAQGEVVTRDQLFDAVWPGGVVSDATLTQCIVELRRALGDSARRPRYIETVPKVGFRLVATAEPVTDETSGGAETASQSNGADSAGSRTVRALLLALLVMVVVLAWRLVPEQRASPTGPELTTLAVLPFEDLGADRRSIGLARGLTEELITRLSRLDGLRVTGRTSSFAFEQTEQEPMAIARALGVSYLLDGSVHEYGGKLRITAQLLDPLNGFILWTEVFDRPAEDYFYIQQEIAESVATALSINLDVGELGQIPGETSNYEVYLKVREAWALWDQMTVASALQAIERLEAATAEDPLCAVCWFDLSLLYTLALNIHGTGLPAREWTGLANDALEEARRIEPQLPGLMAMQLDIHVSAFDWLAAEAVAAQAGHDLKANPEWNFAYGAFKIKVGQLGGASESFRLARRMEPLDPHVAAMHAHIELLSGRTGEALAEYERAWEMELNNRTLASSMATSAALVNGEPDTIRFWLERQRESADPLVESFLRGLDETLDDSPAALAFLQDAFDRHVSSDYWIAEWAAYHGDNALAFRAVERARGIWAVWSPLMKPLRQHPEFPGLLENWGLVEYWRAHGWGDFCRPLGSDRIVCE
jgi:TolB-like protein/DNA-binding winged helix-turn-helix (wHTH) protein